MQRRIFNVQFEKTFCSP